MCGLTGFLDLTGPTRARLEATAHGMADTIVHRGPDDEGTWVDEESGFAFGFRRLAIVDLSPQGHQPMASATGRFVLAFNGEIYNYRALRQELERAAGGIAWRGHSDTEVLLAGFERWGVEGTIGRIVGMFALAVWDRRERTLRLARDRMGEKPLYYGWQGDVFLFGSELKALRAHPAFAAEIDRDALIPFLRHKYIPAPLSIYRGIRKLPPASILTLRRDDPDRAPAALPYWSARHAAEVGVAHPFEGTAEEAVDRLEALIRESVGLQMVADVPLGALLSGGVDSSTVVALMQAQADRPVRTFTIGFEEPGFNEAEHAKAVARHLGTDHTELYVTPAEALDVVPRLPTLYDEPFSDVSQIPTFLVSQMARRHVTVSLSGDGGDELFGGYTRYLHGQRVWRSVRWAPLPLRTAAGRGLTAVSPAGWDRVLTAVRPVLPAAARQRTPGEKLHKLATVLATDTPEAMYRHLVTDWADAERVVVGGREPALTISDARRWLPLEDARQRMMYLDLMTYLPDDILTKVDRASMGVSLEVRAPFLDHRIVEFAWRLPMAYKIRNGTGKWVLRRVLDRHVPRELIDRPKMGFTMPIHAWLRGPLREWGEGLLAEDRLRREGFFDPAPIRQKWEQHLAGTGSWAYLLWDVLMFQVWLEGQR